MTSPLHAVRTIAKRELVAYFTSPVAYVFLVIFLLLTGFLTFTAGGCEGSSSVEMARPGPTLARSLIASVS